MTIVDLTHALGPATYVSAGYPPVEISVLSTVNDPAKPGQRSLNSSRLTTGLHCGTHMDAPFHFFENGQTIDHILMEHCTGPAILLNMAQKQPRETIGPADLLPYQEKLQQAGKAVINTGWHKRWGQPDYFTAHPVLSASAAQLLVDWGVHLVGIDTPSVDYPPNEAHVVLLSGGALIVENLTNLDRVTASVFEFIALPLPIIGREASPVRAIAVWSDV